MKEHQRDSNYPYIGYNPERQWCAFSFELFTQFFEWDKGYVHPADKKYTSEEMKKYYKVIEQNKKEFMDKFPIDKLVEKHGQAELIKRFTGIKDNTGFIPRLDDSPGVLIYTNIPVYATQLNIAVETSFLHASMHNGALADIGLLMTAYGLRALKTLYDTYDVYSGDLPILDFQKDYLKAIIPMIHIGDEKNYDFKVRKIQPEIKENSVEFVVPYSIGNFKVRSETAFLLLAKTSQQAERNLFLYEEKQKEAQK